MPRTTIDIDAAVLQELEARKRREGKTLGGIVSELLASALRRQDERPIAFAWHTRPMGAMVDLEDKEALRRALDEP